MEQIKLAFSRAISYCLAALIALLSIGPFAPRVTVQEPVTTQSKFLIYEVRAVALMGEPIHFQLEQEQDGKWIRLEIRPDYAVYGEGMRRMSHFACEISLHAMRWRASPSPGISLGAPFSPCHSVACGAYFAQRALSASTFS